jgi:hypothetical protein
VPHQIWQGFILNKNVAKEGNAKESDSQLLFSTLSRALAAHAFCTRVRLRYKNKATKAKGKKALKKCFKIIFDSLERNSIHNKPKDSVSFKGGLQERR